jgi:hypothetical protein
MSIAHLYRITNKVTGEYYLGKHNGLTQKNYSGQDYWGSGRRIQNQIKKYGKDNFTYKILVIGPVDYIYELEKKYVTVDLVEHDEKCLNLTIGGQGVNYHTKESKQKLREARKNQIIDYTKSSKTMSTLTWMNDGVRSYRVRPESMQDAKNKGLVSGRLTAYINDEYKENSKKRATQLWQKVKQTGHSGHLIKVN